jgi:hypothetical protein
VLVALVAFAVFSGVFAASSAGSSATYRVPSSIAADCSADVTQELLSWIGSVPNNSVLLFGANGCYRIEGTLELRNRSGLTLDGNGSSFRSFNAPTSHRALWRLIDSSAISLRNMSVVGSYKNGGSLDSNLQWAHAVDLRGTAAEIANVHMSDVSGDCVYYGLGGRRSSGVLRDSSCSGTGRSAVSIVAGDDITIERNTTATVGYNVFNIEPNTGTGFGSARVRINANTIGSYKYVAFSIVPDGPVSDVAFTNNRVTGRGLKIAFGSRTHRPANITVSGNSADTAQAPAAMNFARVDGLTVTNNNVPLTGGAMATVVESCDVSFSGNSFPGGSTQAIIYPWICALAPASGGVGTTVELAGAGFTGATTVAFSGSPAAFTVESDAKIAAVVPPDASSGFITVTTASGSAESSTAFEVTSSTEPAPAESTSTVVAAPTISSFSPGSGPPGTRVVITGTAFADATAVAFAGVSASFTVDSASRIIAFVPRRAKTGKVSVKTPGGTAWSTTRFWVTKK